MMPRSFWVICTWKKADSWQKVHKKIGNESFRLSIEKAVLQFTDSFSSLLMRRTNRWYRFSVSAFFPQ